MIWIQTPTVPQDRWRLKVDAAYHVGQGFFVTGVEVYDEAGALVGALTRKSDRGMDLEDMQAWVSGRLLDVHDALVPPFP